VSDVSSAGIARAAPGYGKTCRKDVRRGVDVPVVPGAARRARPVPRRKRELREQVPARRAAPGRRIEAVDHDHVPPGPLRLVLDHAAEGTPAAVRDALRQGVVADHVPDGEVLQHDQVVVAHELGAGPVQEIGAGVADFPMGAGDLRLRLGPVLAAFLAAGEPALVTGQAPGLALKMTRIGDLLSVAGHGEVLDTEVNADDSPGSGKLLRHAGLDGEGDVPPAVRLAGDRHRGRVDGGRVDVRPGPGESQRRVGLGQEQSAVPVAEPGAGVLGGLPATAGLEPRVAAPPGEEPRECGLLVPDGLLERDAGDLAQPPHALLRLHRRQVGAGLGIARPRLLVVVPLAAPGQGPVPHDADAAEGAVQHPPLHLVGIGPAPVRRPHSQKAYSSDRDRVSMTRERGSGVSFPGLKAGISTPQIR
jgi:hypothetical protein